MKLPESLTAANHEFSNRYPGDSGHRQPVHTVYGGAHLFKADLCRKMGAIAEKTLAEYAPDAATLALAIGIPNPLADIVYERVIEKLRRDSGRRCAGSDRADARRAAIRIVRENSQRAPGFQRIIWPDGISAVPE